MTGEKGYVQADYLDRLRALLATAKQRSYEWMHAGEGSRVLDVGCGPGTDTIPLAKIVGPTGRVVGIDRDPEMVAKANERAAENGVSEWTTHHVGDAAVIPFEDGELDAVRADRIFQHLLDPVPTFREMVRVTKVGGYVVVVDTDYASSSATLDERELERRFVRAVVEQGVNNGYAAREMVQLFQGFHLKEVELEFFPVATRNYAVAREFGRWDSIEKIALELDLLNQDEIEHLHASGERADEEGSFVLHFNMILTAGRKG